MAPTTSNQPAAPPERPWARTADEVLDALDVSPDRGLGESEADRRRERFGPNRIGKSRSKGAWRILLEQFKNIILLLLVAATVLSFAVGEWTDGIAIAVVVVITVAIGFVTEWRALRSMESLSKLSRVEVEVRRGGEARTIDARDLVPGDIVELDRGDLIGADLRMIEAEKLQADESTLTGESVPVGKHVEPVQEDTPLAERSCMLFKGTAVTRGKGRGVVVATGSETQLGEISSLAREAEEEQTPLERRLDRLGRRLAWITIGIAAALSLLGILVGKQTVLMIKTAIALAVAAIPEGLPIVATVALARGMWRMARRNALINRLSAVETLGATNIICTDKTGTLTENRMTVTRLALDPCDVRVDRDEQEGRVTFSIDDQSIGPDDDPVLRRALEVGVLCNNASLPEQREDSDDSGGGDEGPGGDPMEVALLRTGAGAGIDRDDLENDQPRSREVGFDPDVKMMATFHESGDGSNRVAVKGAPEAVLDACDHIATGDGDRELDDEERSKWLDRGQGLAEEGLRMLALAEKQEDSDDAEPYERLTLLGLVGLLDPPRKEVAEAIRRCREAGIRVVMVTGDQGATARNVAVAVDMVAEDEVEVVQGPDIDEIDDISEEQRDEFRNASIFSRVEPREKLNLIALFQQTGAVVAMTGDGVNDAPALKKADIGVAMGRRGTQVAREAADMVLMDDSFATIVAAVEQGRIIFANIRKFLVYLMSSNAGEIIAVAAAALVGAPLPLLPLQILYLNLGNGVLPALALGLGEGNPDYMKRRPRDPGEPVMTRGHWLAILGYGLLLAVPVLGAFALAFRWLGMDRDGAISVAFLTLGLMQLWHVFNMRDRSSGTLRNDITRNRYIWGALGLCLLLLVLAAYLPGLSSVLKVTAPGLRGWGLVLVMSLIPLIVGQALKSFPFSAIRGASGPRSAGRVRPDGEGESGSEPHHRHR